MFDALRLPVLTLLALALILAGLWGVNLPRRQRYAQWWSPPVALGLGVFLLVQYVRRFEQIQADGLMPLLEAVLGEIDLPDLPTPELGVLAFNLLVVAGYAFVKTIVHLLLALPLRFRPGRGFFGWTHRRAPRRAATGPDVDLRPDWAFPGLVFRHAGWILGGLLLLVVWFEAAIRPLPFAVFALPVVPLLLLLETGWFLADRLPEDGGELFRGEDVAARRVGAFEPLWRQYQERWAPHLLAAARWTRHIEPPPGAPYHPGPADGDDSDRLTERWNRLLRAGLPLTQTHYEALDLLLTGRDLLLKEAVYEDAAPVLFSALEAHLIDAKRVLALVDADRRASQPRQQAVADWLTRGLNPDAPTVEPVWQVARLDALQRGGIDAHLVVASPDELLRPGALGHPWFGQVDILLVLNATATAMSHVASVRALASLFAGRQVIVLSDRRLSLESALRDLLGANFEERSLTPFWPDARYALVWRTEAPDGQPTLFQSSILPDDQPPVAPETVLALPAYREGVRPIRPLGIEGLPWSDYVEELAQSTALRAEGFRSADLLPQTPSWLTPVDDRPMLLVRDREHNLVAALREYLPVGRLETLTHVVSPPYLFRDYFAAHLEYLLTRDNPPAALAPRVAEKSAYTIAYTLLERMVAGPVAEADVLRALHLVDPGVRVAEAGLQALFARVFGIDLEATRFLQAETQAVFEDGAFRTHVSFRLARDIKTGRGLAWLRPFEIRDTGNHLQGTILRDHVYQTYLPGQRHAFHTQAGRHGESKSYRIREIQEPNGVVLTDKEDTLARLTAYRPVLHVTLDDAEFSTRDDARRTQRMGGLTLDLAHGAGRFAVRTDGYFTFHSALSRTAPDTSYTPLDPPIERVYPFGQMLRLRFVPAAPAERPEAVARTLAVLLNEAKPTFFPETHNLLWACTAAEAGPADETRPLAHALPTLERRDGDDDAPEGAIDVYLLEDSHADMGLVRCCFEEWRYVLEQLGDYLAWVLDEPAPGAADAAAGGWRIHVDDPGAFLRYGYAELPEGLDLHGARRVLERAFGGQNPTTLHRRRGGGSGAGMLRPAQHYGTQWCDFCGRLLPAVHETLGDGRQRCADCAEGAVDTRSALRRVYDEARAYLADDLGVDLTRAVTIDFADARTIAEAQRRPFMPTGLPEPRAVGLAVGDPTGGFTIYVENGHPYARTLATTVHELTHIWQFTHLDIDRLVREHGLLYIEGHAKWAELDCIERRGLDPAYVAEEQRRTDVYGNGYRAVIRVLEETGQADPFQWLRTQYGVK